jgi:hypothetical protein
MFDIDVDETVDDDDGGGSSSTVGRLVIHPFWDERL